jgi:hypothetical protein
MLKVNRFAVLNTWRLSCININKMESISQLNCGWSASQRHSDIAINGGSISRTALTNKQQWPLLGCLLFGRGNGRQRATADCVVGPSELPKCNVYVIGMCQIRQAQSHKFEVWSWSNIGHGNYCVWFRRICLFSQRRFSKLQILSFEFGTGDVLHFEYDPKQGKLTVQNQKGGRYELSVERKGEKYAVCAYLLNIGDAVELMDS